MNDPAAGNRTWPVAIAVVIVTVALLTVLLMAGYLFLPDLISARLPADQLRRLGLADFRGRISTVGLFRTVAGPFVFGHAHRPALFIGSVEVDYTPEDLFDKKIDRIRIRDVGVHATLGPEGISFPGWDRDALGAVGTSESEPNRPGFDVASFRLDRVEIRSGHLYLKHDTTAFTIPFEVDLVPAGAGLNALTAHVRFFPRDQHFTLVVRADLDKRQARIKFDAPRLALDAFADLFRRIAGLDAAGAIALRGGAVCGWRPLRLTEAHLGLTWLNGRIDYGSLQLSPAPGQTPAAVSAVYTDSGTWQIHGQGVRSTEPLPLALEEFAAILQLDPASTRLTGTTRVASLPVAVDTPLAASLKSRTDHRLRFEATQSKDQGWSASLATDRSGTQRATRSSSLMMGVAGTTLRVAAPRLNLAATGRGREGELRWELALGAVEIDTSTLAVTLPPATATGDVRFGADDRGPVYAGGGRIQFPGLTVVGHGVAGNLETVIISARVHRQATSALVLTGRLKCMGGRLDYPDSDLHASGLQADLPFGMNDDRTGDDGAFSVARVTWQNRDLGEVKGRLRRQPGAYTVNADFVRRLAPAISAVMHGRVWTAPDRLGEADFTLNLPDTHLPAGTDLGRFLPAAKGVMLSGNVSAHLSATVSSTGTAGALEVVVAGGGLTVAERKIAVTGIDTALQFPELPRLRSAPAQTIRFARAAMGGIVVDGGSFDVQVESGGTLLVEKGRLAWCGGKVDLQSLRITAGRQEYAMSLYCQRLGLSRILEQLGAVNARGSGTVNGRIPITYSGGKIRFDDGFLFSTPGEGGSIQITNTEILTRGIPRDTPQFAQVELAREALKDYAYDWAKLGLQSEGEDFVMRLQFNGKPVHPLPFVYDREIGSFVRVAVGKQGSVFQGIALDVNLRLPLNRLLQYKDIVNMIQ